MCCFKKGIGAIANQVFARLIRPQVGTIRVKSNWKGMLLFQVRFVSHVSQHNTLLSRRF